MKKLLFFWICCVLSLTTSAQISWLNVGLQSDAYGSETTWEIYLGDSVVAFSPLYLDDSYQQVVIPLPAGEYSFVIYDAFGDGICCAFGTGYFTLQNSCGLDTVVTDFGSPSMTVDFNLTPCSPPLLGCMEETATNYNPWANMPGACTFPPAICGGPQATLFTTVIPDSYPMETSWSLTANGVEVGSGSGYQNVGVPVVVGSCVFPGDTLVMSVYDSFGDGLCGTCWGGVDGSVLLTNLCGDTLYYAGGTMEFDTASSPALIVPDCFPLLAEGCTDPAFVEYDSEAVENNGTCLTPVILGCIDSTMFNYNVEATVMEMHPACEYTFVTTDGGADGWFGSWVGLKQGDILYGPFQMGPEDGYEASFEIMLNSGEDVSAYFFTEGNAATTATQCGFRLEGPNGVVLETGTNPWTDPIKKFPYEYHALPVCENYCIEYVYGCTDEASENFNSAANSEDASCYYASGCMQAGYLEYYTQGYEADFDNGSCETLAVFGCMDSTAFNYDALANVDNLGCLPVIEGCMNPLAFNYDPLANTNSDCTPFIYGCTDPTAFNYDVEANTDSQECIDVILGCTDDTALNYNPLANTDNDGCVLPVEGCMDLDAWNYDAVANVPVLEDCLYDAGCVTGPGNPYWLNDSCYAWVIEVDPYCCESVWDGGCVGLYDYCSAEWPTSIEELDNQIIIHPNPTLGFLRIDTSLPYTFSVYHPLGFVVVNRSTARQVDLSKWPSGAYHMILESNGNIYRKTIIKQ